MSSPLTPMQVTGIALGAVGVVSVFGLPTIKLLRRAGAGQRVRNDGPHRHLHKAGTPTMGGVLILGGAIVVALFGHWWANGGLNLQMVTLLALPVAVGCIGAADDWQKIRRGRSLGLRARQKLVLQLIAATAFVYALTAERSVQAALEGNSDPISAGPLWPIFWVLAIAATSNAINLADGLDGLAAGLCVIAAAGFAVLGLQSGEQEVAILALALAGACAAFLGFNLHPAKVFMGDVGSLALGAALAAMAARLNQPLALIGLCLVPFIAELSVIAQVIAFKTTGRRVLRMSPIHHHFELSGWSEQRVVLTFWLAGIAAAGLVVARSLIS